MMLESLCSFAKTALKKQAIDTLVIAHVSNYKAYLLSLHVVNCSSRFAGAT